MLILAGLVAYSSHGVVESSPERHASAVIAPSKVYQEGNIAGEMLKILSDKLSNPPSAPDFAAEIVIYTSLLDIGRSEEEIRKELQVIYEMYQGLFQEKGFELFRDNEKKELKEAIEAGDNRMFYTYLYRHVPMRQIVRTNNAGSEVTVSLAEAVGAKWLNGLQFGGASKALWESTIKAAFSPLKNLLFKPEELPYKIVPVINFLKEFMEMESNIITKSDVRKLAQKLAEQPENVTKLVEGLTKIADVYEQAFTAKTLAEEEIQNMVQRILQAPSTDEDVETVLCEDDEVRVGLSDI